MAQHDTQQQTKPAIRRQQQSNIMKNPLTLLPLVASRLATTIHADTSDPHKLSIGLVGGDIPVFPPLALLLVTAFGLLAWRISQKRYRFIPKRLQSLVVRIPLMAIGIGTALQTVTAAEEELARVGAIANFSNVSLVATQGTYAWSRNGLYIGLFVLEFSLAFGLDAAWLLASLLVNMVCIDQFVVPAEENFLTRELGTEYQQYCETVPRWLF